MSKELRDVKPDVTWKEITSGGVIDSPGNAHLFKTGDWRSMKPVWNEENASSVCFATRYVLIHP